MAGTFTNLIYHVVFSTKRRKPMIFDTFQQRLYAYIGGIVREKSGRLLSIGGTEDHIHMLDKLKPVEAVSKTIGELKGNSSKWLNEKSFLEGRFSWQIGFGTFSASESQFQSVARYIESQKEHHKKQSFKDEFIAMLDKHKIMYDPRYIWD